MPKEVIATDVNARALAYTELNAALNGIRNIECREGSLFEPVQGEKFDLIICNAPYVVSPETRWAYRDGGFAADDVSQRVVTTAAEHLRDGGYAALLVSWLGFEERQAGRAAARVDRVDRLRHVDPPDLGRRPARRTPRPGTTTSRTTRRRTRRRSPTGRAISATSASTG